MHDEALRLAGQHGFRIHDALIVAAALEAGCAALYTEDLHSGQVIDGRLTIRNAFKGQVEGASPRSRVAHDSPAFARSGRGAEQTCRVLARH